MRFPERESEAFETGIGRITVAEHLAGLADEAFKGENGRASYKSLIRLYKDIVLPGRMERAISVDENLQHIYDVACRYFGLESYSALREQLCIEYARFRKGERIGKGSLKRFVRKTVLSMEAKHLR